MATVRRHRPRKRFGQHFLEPPWARKVVDAISPRPDEAFLEIGPGRGVLTRLLAASAHDVVAVEIDRDLAAALAEGAAPNVRVVTADFLAVDPAALLPADATRPARVAGNLPYNISSPILFRLLASQAGHGRWRDATLMLQHEVAARLVAEPGTGDYGVLTVLVGHRARVRRLLTLPPGAFRPAPRVTSAVVEIAFRRPADVLPVTPSFEPLVRAVFTRRRKTTANALGAWAGLSAADAKALAGRAGIDPSRRPETLSVAEFAALAGLVTGGPAAPPAVL